MWYPGVFPTSQELVGQVGRIEYWHDLLHTPALKNACSRKGMRPVFNSEVKSDKLLPCRLLFDGSDYVLNGRFESCIRTHSALDTLTGMHYRCVVPPAELEADFRG